MKIIKFLLLALFAFPVGLLGMGGAILLGLTIIGLPFAGMIFMGALSIFIAPFAVFAEDEKSNADIVKAIEENTRALKRRQ